MSTELKATNDRNGPVLFTQFAGKADEGKCLQLTPQFPSAHPYITLTKQQALELSAALAEWAADVRPEREHTYVA